MTAEEVAVMRRNIILEVRKNWDNKGLKALVQYIEQKASTAKSRACLPGANQHDAGQGFALEQLVGELQQFRLGGTQPGA